MCAGRAVWGWLSLMIFGFGLAHSYAPSTSTKSIPTHNSLIFTSQVCMSIYSTEFSPFQHQIPPFPECCAIRGGLTNLSPISPTMPALTPFNQP